MNLPLPFTVVVSGLPRSGTSLMMQMLKAGGIPILTDGVRKADEDNPLGYFEWEPVKQLRTNRAWIDSAVGRAVKIIHLLLPELPNDRPYRVLFMRRNMSEVLASQQTMLDRQGKKGAGIGRNELATAYEAQIQRVLAFLATAENIQLLELSYADLLADAGSISLRLQEFLGCELDRAAMHRCVDPNLYRNRVASTPDPAAS